MMLRITLSVRYRLYSCSNHGQGIVVRCAVDRAAIPDVAARGKGGVRRRRGFYCEDGGGGGGKTVMSDLQRRN